MKKLLLLFCILCMTTFVNAQVDFCIGPKVGYQATKLSLDDVSIKSDFQANMSLGVFGRVSVNKFIIQPELLWSKSTKMVEVLFMYDTPGNPSLAVKQNNMVLPIHIGYQFIDLDFVKMRVTIAPVFYFAMGKTKFVSESFKIKSEGALTEKVSAGAIFNVGFDVWRFTFDAGYSLGLTETMDDDIELRPPFDYIKIGDDTKQNVFTLTLGFKFL